MNQEIKISYYVEALGDRLEDLIEEDMFYQKIYKERSAYL